MSEHTVTLTLPATMYKRLEERAEASGRTVRDEIFDAVAARSAELPSELEDALSSMPFYSDDALWQAARSHLAEEDAAELERLHHKRDLEGLSDEEKQVVAELLCRYDRFMLVRAQAAALLKQRGHDVSVLLRAS